MNNFDIQDAQLLLSQAGNLEQANQNILRAQEQLSDCCSQISSAWQSNTEDKSSYLSTLQKNLEKLFTLTSAIHSLSGKLTSFAQQSINTANNS